MRHTVDRLRVKPDTGWAVANDAAPAQDDSSLRKLHSQIHVKRQAGDWSGPGMRMAGCPLGARSYPRVIHLPLSHVLVLCYTAFAE
jgi:hypothetical protein